MQFTIASITAILALTASAAAAPAADIETRDAAPTCSGKSYIDLFGKCSRGQVRYNVFIPAKFNGGSGCTPIKNTLDSQSRAWNKGDTYPNGIGIEDYTCKANGDGSGTWLGFDWCEYEKDGVNSALSTAYPAFAGKFTCGDGN